MKKKFEIFFNNLNLEDKEYIAKTFNDKGFFFDQDSDNIADSLEANNINFFWSSRSGVYMVKNTPKYFKTIIEEFNSKPKDDEDKYINEREKLTFKRKKPLISLIKKVFMATENSVPFWFELYEDDYSLDQLITHYHEYVFPFLGIDFSALIDEATLIGEDISYDDIFELLSPYNLTSKEEELAVEYIYSFV